MSKEKIMIRDVSKRYIVDDREVTVFDHLNLTIDPDEITILIGKSGCGKTTLLRLLAGLEKPDAGEILIPENRHIGMVFQEPRLMPWLTCEKNVTIGMKKAERKESEEILRLVGLEGFEKAYPSQLSGGMKQRASLARTLIRKADLILMDEPFAALDGFTRKAMQQELLRIKEETGAGIIFVTHDMAEAMALGDRVINIRNHETEEVGDEKNII